MQAMMTPSDTELNTFPRMVVIAAPMAPRSPREVAQSVAMLTRREREILPMLAARWTDQEIADALCISYRTVTTHVSHIFDKLGINSRREAAGFAWGATVAG